MSETILDKIIGVTREKVEAQKRRVSANEIRERALAVRLNVESFRLSRNVSRKDRTNIIAEIKRASPSKGVINDIIDVAETARRYQEGGACAISVLTEEQFFKGSLEDLRVVRETVDLPILRKDFTIDEFQIHEAAASGADAILLIVAALAKEHLREFQSLAHELGLDALVEVHTVDELDVAAEFGANLIGVNNRNLRTFEVSLDVSREMIRHRPQGALMIAESGISSREQIEELRALGFDGFLVGESLMRAGSEARLLSLVG